MPITLDTDRIRPSLPPVDLIEQPDVRRAVQEWQRAQSAATAAQRDVEQLRRQREGALEADRVLYADAIEKAKGEPVDPGTPNVDEFEAKLRDAERRAEASKLVVARRFADLKAALAEHGDEWAAQAQADLDQARAEMAEAIEALDMRRAELAQAQALVAFTTGRTKGYRASSSGGRLPIRRSGEHHVAFDSVIEAMRGLTRPPEPQGEHHMLEAESAA